MKKLFVQVSDGLRRGWRWSKKTLSSLPLLRTLVQKLQRTQGPEDISWHPAEEREALQYGRDDRGLVLTRRAWWYAALLIFGLLFTQILRSRASSIFFWFLLLMLPALLVYTLIARAALQASIETASTEIEKHQPYDYEFCMTNSSPLAFPVVDAILNIAANEE